LPLSVFTPELDTAVAAQHRGRVSAGLRVPDAQMQNVGHVPRAPRFAVRAPVRYRRPGEPAWSEGQTVNISRSGVLMSGSGSFDPGDAIQVRVALSAADPNVADVWVLGFVTRVDRAASGDPLIAAAIDTYRFHGEGRLPGALRTDEDI